MTNVYVFVTPAELRALADEMEKKSKTLKLGDSCVIRSVKIDAHTTLQVAWAFDREKHD